MSTKIVSIVYLVLLVSLLACSTSSYVEVSVETPLKPKLDISKFQRILIAGFVADSANEVNTNLETARLLRSQLRTNSRLQVIDAEVIELIDIAEAEIGINLRRGNNETRSSDEAVATAKKKRIRRSPKKSSRNTRPFLPMSATGGNLARNTRIH